MMNNRQRCRMLLPAIGAISVVALLGGCAETLDALYGPDSERGPVPIRRIEQSQETLNLIVASCEGNPEATVAESDAEVVIEVVATTFEEGPACREVVAVSLNQELGERAVVDESTGEKVTEIMER